MTQFCVVEGLLIFPMDPAGLRYCSWKEFRSTFCSIWRGEFSTYMEILHCLMGVC